MNLSTIWYAVSDLFQTFSPARRTLKLYMFNIYLQMVDTDLLRDLLRMKFNPSHDINDNDEQLDLLQKFKTSTTIDSSATPALPSGYMRFIAAYDGDVEVEYVDMDEYTDRVTNSLTAPSTTYPVLYITNGTIVTAPTTIGTYTFWYYAALTGASKPTLALAKTNGVTQYDSGNSVQLVWPEYMYPRIVMMILKYLGISINDPNLIQEKLKEIADAT